MPFVFILILYSAVVTFFGFLNKVTLLRNYYSNKE